MGAIEIFGQQQVPPQRLQHMLPGPGGAWIAHLNRFSSPQGSHRIWHDAIFRPVAAADHIACPGGGNGKMGRLVHRCTAEAAAPAGDGNFGSGLAGAVGVMAAETIVFSIAVIPFAVGIHLVGGDHHHGAGILQPFQCFEHLQAALHIGAPGAQRIPVAAPHQRLGRQM